MDQNKQTDNNKKIEKKYREEEEHVQTLRGSHPSRLNDIEEMRTLSNRTQPYKQCPNPT